ncbi:MAG: S8 family serine peptidase, partial [Planctomycetota bacterium]
MAVLGLAAAASGDCPGDLDNNGVVDGSDLGILLINWGTGGAGDVDGSGLVDGADVGILLIGWGECPPSEPQISLFVGAADVGFSEGGSYGFASTIRVDGVGDTPLTVAITTSASSASLTAVDDVPDGGFTIAANGTEIFNTLLSSAVSGGYTYTITATPDVGEPVSVSLPVTVVPINGIPSLAPMAAAPSAVNPGVANAVVFTLGLSGTTAPPASFTLYETDPTGGVIGSAGTLRDDGAGPDVVANDGVYTTAIAVTPGIDEDARYYRACEGGGSCGTGLESEVLTLDVTSYPVGTSASDPDSLVVLPDGREIYADELLLVFVDGTSETRIGEVVASIDGTVVGSIPATGAYQIGIPGDSTGENVMNAIAAMKTVVDVDTADPIFPITPAELVPNDPLWPLQVGVAAIRAPETWTIATGAVAIAVVDTGVDATHPDLAGKVVVLPGSDVLDGDDDPSDPDGHGTRMAGIAAAIGNNLYAVAGVSWSSPVIAVRAFGAGGSDVSLASGIVFAAANGARVISVSGTLREASPVIVDAVEFARERGCLIVASAGNTNGGPAVETYPCALEGVLCVGAVDGADRPLEGTNSGPWVDLAAPGEDVPTITPGADVAIVSGTSPAAAMVAGAAAVLWSTEPSLTAAEVGDRLQAGAAALDGHASTLGAGRVDLFESTFDGSFELPGLGTWETDGTVSVLTSLGPIVPTDRDRMVYISTGPAAANAEATLRKEFLIQPGVTEFGISFDYDFVTEEWPEFVGDQFNDSLRIVLVEPDGNEILLAVESINESIFFPVEGINFPGGDQTVGHTGWKTVSAVIPVTKGPGVYSVRIEDAGDSLYDSVVLLDRIRLVGDPNALFCGAPAAGNCCEPREAPFCVDAACCNAVCLYDPTCCQVAWDARCADVALALCDGLCGTPTQEICNNGLDDDYDTLTDCEDPDCEGEPNCGPGPGEICANGVDDDGDGLVDCDDPECAGFPQCEEGQCGDPDAGDCCEANNTPHCTDAACCDTVCAVDPFCCDSAWDDLCASQAVDLCNGLCEPPVPEDCRNGVDDDGDGLVDCDDPDCADDTACPPSTEDCTNGVDDDGDGLVDCEDPDCGKDPACGAAFNDECDGAIDLVDGVNAVDNLDGTTGTTQPPAECAKNGGTTIHHDVWYRYTPTCSGI